MCFSAVGLVVGSRWSVVGARLTASARRFGFKIKAKSIPYDYFLTGSFIPFFIQKTFTTALTGEKNIQTSLRL